MAKKKRLKMSARAIRARERTKEKKNGTFVDRRLRNKTVAKKRRKTKTRTTRPRKHRTTEQATVPCCPRCMLPLGPFNTAMQIALEIEKGKRHA